ncbi:TPA: hypothetical protein ACPFP8_000102 [Enterobacter ludwigii]
MNNKETKTIKYSSTKAFYAMAKHIYVTGIRKYKEQGDHDLVASIILDNDKTESYISHVKDYLAKCFDEHMEEAGKRESLIYVDMDKVMVEMKRVHIKSLLFSMS